jgi:hypothetical protein
MVGNYSARPVPRANGQDAKGRHPWVDGRRPSSLLISKEGTVLTLNQTLDDLTEDLQVRGYTLIRAESDPDIMTEAASAIGHHLGASWMGVRVLEAESDPSWLPQHTEQLDDDEPLRFLALGCLSPASEGGATCLYDGRVAARALLAESPELAAVRLTYSTR